MDDEHFNSTQLAKHVAAIRRDVNQIRASIQVIDQKMEIYDQLFRCPCCDHSCEGVRNSRNANLECGSHNHASSMLSVREILEDYRGRKATYEGGDRGLAAAEAWEFFDRAHKRMRPKLANGVMFSAGGGDFVTRKPGTTPAQAAGISPSMQCYKLLTDGGCIWVPDEATEEVKNEQGTSHHVTIVTTSEGQRVVVDWGIAQYSHLPKDIRLFIKNCM